MEIILGGSTSQQMSAVCIFLLSDILGNILSQNRGAHSNSLTDIVELTSVKAMS